MKAIIVTVLLALVSMSCLYGVFFLGEFYQDNWMVNPTIVILSLIWFLGFSAITFIWIGKPDSIFKK